MDRFIVTFAKVTLHKQDGVLLNGVFFGGAGSTQEEADQIAKDCVNTIRGGTIMPKTIEVNDNEKLIDALYEVHDDFEQLISEMAETQKTYQRAIVLKKKK